MDKPENAVKLKLKANKKYSLCTCGKSDTLPYCDNNHRIFNDENDIMNKNVNEVNGEVLVVSQFTLCGNVKKGNRPSYIEAAKPDIAKPIYNLFIKQLDSLINNKVQSGIFGAYMLVDIVNDGPVTLIV